MIGGGVVGATAALECARAGAGVVLLERDSLGDACGASKGGARIYVPAAYPDEEYLEMGLHAVERWRDVEARTGKRLLFLTAVLSAGKFAERQLPLLGAAGEKGEPLEPAAAERHFRIRFADRRAALHQPDAEVTGADRALRGLLRLARGAGAELVGAQAVDVLEPGDDHVVVRAGRVAWRARAAIVASGPWSGSLLARAGIEVRLAVTRQTVAHFELPSATGALPAVIDYDGDEPFALWDPAGRLKAGSMPAARSPSRTSPLRQLAPESGRRAAPPALEPAEVGAR